MSDVIHVRLTHLESTVTHLERLVEQLNSVVTDQARDIGHLRKHLQRHSQTLEAIELERIKSTNPKPPHNQ